MDAGRVLAVIPARLGSTRMARKPLAPLLGKPLVQWTYEAAARARGVGALVVATDSEEVARAVRAFGGTAEMTESGHPSGTDRVAEVARRRPEAEVVINIQGDEPMLPPEYLEALLAPFASAAPPAMATLAAPVEGTAGFDDPGVAKIVADRAGNALYFSRAPIPFHAGGGARAWLRHIGVYAFTRRALLDLVARPPSPLERAERLEQLRALENGIAIRLVEVPCATHHVDTQDDLTQLEALLRGR
jgi:3-deoxy-manno-octulosonate cytidylyltransferase (CMP-KDO synthetase)